MAHETNEQPGRLRGLRRPQPLNAAAFLCSGADPSRLMSRYGRYVSGLLNLFIVAFRGRD